MTMRGSLCTTAIVALLLVAFGASPVLAQGKQDQMKALLLAANDLAERGHEDEAVKKMDELLALDPSAEDAFAMKGVLEAKAWSRLAVKNDRLGAALVALHDRSIPAATGKTGDPEAIKKLIVEMHDPDWMKVQKAFLALSANHGEYASAHLCGSLGSPETDTRVFAMDWIRKLGRDSGLPLIQVLKADKADILARTNAAICLGMLHDERAVPYLMWFGEHASEAPFKDAAMQALRRIGGAQGSALEAMQGLGERYYRRDMAVVNNYRTVYPVWVWTDKGLDAHEVPRDIYHLKLAEDVLFDALRADAGNFATATALISVLLAEGEMGRGMPTEGDGGAVGSALQNARVMAALAGTAVLDAVVAKAINDGRNDVALAAVRLLGTMENADSFHAGSGLSSGLTAPFKSVRFASALALAKIKPRVAFEGSNLVVPALAEALGQDVVRNVVVMDDNRATREELLTQLNGGHWFAIGADDGATGIMRLREPPVEDLVIVRYNIGGTPLSSILRGIAADESTKNVPVVLLVDAANAEAAKAQYGDKVKGMITLPLNRATYEPALKELVKTVDAARDAAIMTAAAAAHALADMDPRGAGFSSAGAVAALAGSLKGDDRVRMPAVMALGAIADPAAVAALVELFSDASASEALRAEAAVALARTARSTGAMAPEFVAALRAMADTGGSAAFMGRVAEAIGLCPISTNTRANLLRMYRPKTTIDLVK